MPPLFLSIYLYYTTCPHACPHACSRLLQPARARRPTRRGSRARILSLALIVVHGLRQARHPRAYAFFPNGEGAGERQIDQIRLGWLAGSELGKVGRPAVCDRGGVDEDVAKGVARARRAEEHEEATNTSERPARKGTARTRADSPRETPDRIPDVPKSMSPHTQSIQPSHITTSMPIARSADLVARHLVQRSRVRYRWQSQRGAQLRVGVVKQERDERERKEGVDFARIERGLTGVRERKGKKRKRVQWDALSTSRGSAAAANSP